MQCRCVPGDLSEEEPLLAETTVALGGAGSGTAPHVHTLPSPEPTPSPALLHSGL